MHWILKIIYCNAEKKHCLISFPFSSDLVIAQMNLVISCSNVHAFVLHANKARAVRAIEDEKIWRKREE